MKKFLVISLSAGALFLFSAFSKTHNFGNISSGVYKIMEVTYLWQLLQTDYQIDYDRDHTWVESGFRAKYASAKRYASLDMIEKAFGEKVFISGPHGRDMDFTSTTSFGHYNPSFLNSLHRAVETILDNSTFNTAAQYFYDEYFSDMMKSYGTAYDYLNENPEKKAELKERYLKELANPNGTTGGSLLNHVGEIVQLHPDLDVYEAYAAPSFWIRRSIDGTEDEFVKILQLIVEELD